MPEKKIGKNGSATYQSYLLRLWRSEHSHFWLASLETPGTHECHSFPDLATCFAFLQAQTSTTPDQVQANHNIELIDPRLE